MEPLRSMWSSGSKKCQDTQSFLLNKPGWDQMSLWDQVNPRLLQNCLDPVPSCDHHCHLPDHHHVILETDISVTSVTTQQHRGSKLTLPFLVTTSFEINLWMIFNFYSLHCMHLCKNYLHDNSCPIFAWINSNLHQFPENLKHCKIIGNFLLMQTKLPEQIDLFNWDKRSYKKNIELSAET